MSARSSLGSLALLAWLVTGCATVAHVPRRPISPDAQRALARLDERWREFSDLRTLAEISIERGSQRQHLRGVILAKSPASVRLEALSPLGQPLLLATIHGGRLTAYDTTTNEAYVGGATPEAAARLLGLPFEPEDLVAVLAGRAIPPSDPIAAELKRPDALGPSLEIVTKTDRRRIWMDLESGVVRRIEISGSRVTLITFDRAGDGQMTGLDVAVRATLRSVKASIQYRNPEFGTEIPDDRFSFAIPKGAKIQQIR